MRMLLEIIACILCFLAGHKSSTRIIRSRLDNWLRNRNIEAERNLTTPKAILDSLAEQLRRM